jgi:hypothetical protein
MGGDELRLGDEQPQPGGEDEAVHMHEQESQVVSA